MTGKSPSEWKPEAPGLSREARIERIDASVSSLEEDPEIEHAWLREARRRYEKIRSGSARLIDNEEVFARLRMRFE